MVKFILVDPAPFNIYLKNRSETHLNTSNNDVIYLKYNGKNLDSINIWAGSESMVDFVKNSSYKLYIIQDLYTDELSTTLKELKSKDNKVYFWSDIRTKLDTEGESPKDLDILWNLAQQYNWVKLLKPDAFMLKFRCTYFEDLTDMNKNELIDYINKHITDSSFNTSKKFGIDFISDYIDRKLIYFDGEIYIQPWAPKTSTEVRLVSDNIDRNRSYDCNMAESKFFYYNLIDRTFTRHVNKYTNADIGFDHCNDCALEAKIWEDYGNKFKDNFSVITYVKKLEQLLGRKLKSNGHGFMFGNFNNKKYRYLYESQCLK